MNEYHDVLVLLAGIAADEKRVPAVPEEAKSNAAAPGAWIPGSSPSQNRTTRLGE